MDVTELTSTKSALVFDASAIMPSKDQILRFTRYSMGINNFIGKSGNVALAFLRMPAESNISFTNLSMTITKDPILHLIQKVGEVKPKVFVIFAHLNEVLDNIKAAKAKNTLIITDDEITPQILSQLPDLVKIIPGRILNTFFSSAWWQITPHEQIAANYIQLDTLPDKFRNELNMMADLAWHLHEEQKYEECFDLLELILQWCPNHLPTLLILAGRNAADAKHNRVPDQRETQLARAEQVYLKINDLLHQMKPPNKQTKALFEEILLTIKVLILVILPLLPPERAAKLRKTFPV